MIKNSKSLSKAKEPLLHVRISQLLHALQGKPSWDYQYKLLYIEHLSKRTLGWGYSTLQSTCSAWTQSWALIPSQHCPLSRHPPPPPVTIYWRSGRQCPKAFITSIFRWGKGTERDPEACTRLYRPRTVHIPTCWDKCSYSFYVVDTVITFRSSLDRFMTCFRIFFGSHSLEMYWLWNLALGMHPLLQTVDTIPCRLCLLSRPCSRFYPLCLSLSTLAFSFALERC